MFNVVKKDTDSPLCVPFLVEANDGSVGSRHLCEFHISTLAEFLANQLPGDGRWQLKQKTGQEFLYCF